MTREKHPWVKALSWLLLAGSTALIVMAPFTEHEVVQRRKGRRPRLSKQETINNLDLTVDATDGGVMHKEKHLWNLIYSSPRNLFLENEICDYPSGVLPRDDLFHVSEICVYPTDDSDDHHNGACHRGYILIFPC